MVKHPWLQFQTIDPFTNQFAQTKIGTGNFSANANLDLFTGLGKSI